MNTDNLDMLDDVTAEEAKLNPTAASEWKAMKLVAELIKARKDLGLTQADVAERMGLPQQRVAEVERRPWSASFGRVLAYARAIGIELGVLGVEAVGVGKAKAA